MTTKLIRMRMMTMLKKIFMEFKIATRANLEETKIAVSSRKKLQLS